MKTPDFPADPSSHERFPFIFGSQYYRAPTPEPDCWETDLRAMQALGFTETKFFVQWRWSHRAPDRFYFEDLDRLMRMKARRKVARDRTLRLDGRLYEAPDGFAGETVTVLYDPYDPARPVHLARDDQQDEIPLRRLDATINATLPRARRDDAEGHEPVVATGISYLDLIARGFYGDEGGEG